MAERTGGRLWRLAARLAAMIRIDALWLATTPIDMRMGTERVNGGVKGSQLAAA